MMTAVHNHEKAESALDGNVEQDSGFSDDERTSEFMSDYDLDPQGRPSDAEFDIKCAGCCWQYLTKKRKYDSETDSESGSARKVKFGEAETSCFLAPIERGKNEKVIRNGQVKIKRTTSLGRKGPRPFASSVTYQLYGPNKPSRLAEVKDMPVRVEAIAVTVLKERDQLKGCYFNYANAALLELYREKQGKDSLKGECVWSTEDSSDQKGPDNISVKEEESSDKKGPSNVSVKEEESSDQKGRDLSDENSSDEDEKSDSDSFEEEDESDQQGGSCSSDDASDALTVKVAEMQIKTDREN